MAAQLAQRSNNPEPAPGGFTPLQSDTVDLLVACRSLYCDGAGTVKFNFFDGTGPFTVTVTSGTILPFCMSRIWVAGTTATGLIGLN